MHMTISSNLSYLRAILIIHLIIFSAHGVASDWNTADNEGHAISCDYQLLGWNPNDDPFQLKFTEPEGCTVFVTCYLRATGHGNIYECTPQAFGACKCGGKVWQSACDVAGQAGRIPASACEIIYNCGP